MLLREGALYRAPDGRMLRAFSEIRRHHHERAWTLSPADASDEFMSARLERDRIAGKLIVEGEKLYRIALEDGPTVEDTGWTVRDLAIIGVD